MATHNNEDAYPTATVTDSNWPQLLSKTLDDLSRVARTEIQLLEATFTRLIEAQTDKITGMLVLVVALTYGSLFLLGGVVLLIHLWLAWWLSFLITGLVICSAGVVFQMRMATAAKKITGDVSPNEVPSRDQRNMNQEPQRKSSDETGQGKQAPTPKEIPRSGWWSICKRVYASLNTKHLSILAGGIAFYAMLSIFPALAAVVALYGLIADPATVQQQINAIHGLIPGEAQKVIETYLKSIVTSNASKLGFSLVVSVAIALWSARAGTVSLIQALNITYEEDEKRGAIRFQAVALAMTLAAILSGLIALILIAGIPPVLKFLPLGNSAKIVGYVVPWPILMALVSLGLAATYRFLPSRREAKWRWVSWGGVIATAIWVAASAGFSFYVAKFGNYDKTFGSLGAVVVLLTWLYLSGFVVLIGACFNAEMERQTARDTTSGPEKPMGQRGAKMADTVADGAQDARPET